MGCVFQLLFLDKPSQRHGSTHPHEVVVGVNEGVVLRLVGGRVLAFEAVVDHPSEESMPAGL